MTEKKIKPRMHRRIPVPVAFVIAGGKFKDGKLMEMSEGGLSFSSSQDAAQGTRVTCQLQDGDVELQIEGEVVYSRERGGLHNLGVKFDRLDLKITLAIRDLLRRHRFSQFRSPIQKA